MHTRRFFSSTCLFHFFFFLHCVYYAAFIRHDDNIRDIRQQRGRVVFDSHFASIYTELSRCIFQSHSCERGQLTTEWVFFSFQEAANSCDNTYTHWQRQNIMRNILPRHILYFLSLRYFQRFLSFSSSSLLSTEPLAFHSTHNIL